MKISVVIPVYNRIDSLKTAIESVFCQSYENYEIIVVDDGSEKPVKDFIFPYLHRIRLIELNENRGVSFARNTGIENAKGDYIAFLDSDDIWLPFKLELQVDLIRKNNFKIAHTDEFWWKKGKFVNQGKRHTKYGGNIFSKVLDICRISPSSVLIEKQVFDKVGKFDENLKACEDYDLWLRITSCFETGYIPIKSIIKRFYLDNHLSFEVKHLEYLRLLSLCKFLNMNNYLNFSDKRAVYKEITEKFNIVNSGLIKRK